MNIQPITDRILVKKDKKEFKTESGIIYKTESQRSVVLDREQSGVVVAVGPDVKFIKEGYKVYFSVTSGIDYDDEHLFLTEDSVLGYIS